MTVGIKLYKRVILYLIAGLFFGFAFTAMFSLASGYGYMIGFIQDSAITGASFGILFGITMEITRVVIAKKFKKIKQEISMTSTVVFDAVSNIFLGKRMVNGWIFLTNENLIFIPYRKTQANQDIVISTNEIINLSKISPSGFLIFTNNVFFKFTADNSDKLLSIIEEKLKLMIKTQG